ncbi:tRNA pseudouridine(13) synthase TruD [Shewanella sp. 202IG2-18]|uniref:tRNA pseudouridine(13) synthase TruD n=1 Tax=Parashewanella hymeniacidonis TaxID=2807618 RepID=UPI00195FFC06|nr:tRNA pseudouridine(13) synthase TruD [Parashewanella hymeniacidonis]MBM7071939.1 tRNA pseudouridine(13) synthase TruD [Parashewanella hymeniacidonis]
MTKDLFYLYEKPSAEGNLRTHNSDFIVKEILPIQPTGEGEHHFVHIRKEGLNTNFVAEKLAEFAGVHPRDVTSAGQKDRHAITEQWFGIRIPGKETPDWKNLDLEGVTVLEAHRHNKKLRTGALSGNRFKLTIRNVTNTKDVQSRIEKIQQTGVPNYFGDQRFGHNGKNIEMARQMFSGKKIKDRNKRSIYLSAVRSNLFNQVVSKRLHLHGTDSLEGDCVQLTGSRSFFAEEKWDDTLTQRLVDNDIQLSAPLWGRGELPALGAAADLENAALNDFSADKEGLEKAGLEQERRPLLLKPENLQYEFDNDMLVLEFALPAGSFATSVLREIVNVTDVRQRQAQAAFQEQQKAAQ